MKVSEEVDALTTMGFDRTRFLVTPESPVAAVMLPCLTLIADLVGILGGLTVAAFGARPAGAGVRAPDALGAGDLGCLFRAWSRASPSPFSSPASAVCAASRREAGAESVGRVTTSAIVAGIFLIIVADAVFTVIFHYW